MTPRVESACVLESNCLKVRALSKFWFPNVSNLRPYAVEALRGLARKAEAVSKEAYIGALQRAAEAAEAAEVGAE